MRSSSLRSVSSNRGPYFSHHSRFVSLFLFFFAIAITTFEELDDPREQDLHVEEHLEE